MRWHGPETLQGTGSIDANEFQVMTDMTMACAASRAITAWRERAHGYAITGRETFYDRAKRGDGAGHLVTENLGNVDAVIHGTMENVKVSTTDATIGNLDLHFGGLRRNRRAFADAYRLAPFVVCRLEMTHRDLPLRDGTTKQTRQISQAASPSSGPAFVTPGPLCWSEKSLIQSMSRAENEAAFRRDGILTRHSIRKPLTGLIRASEDWATPAQADRFRHSR